MLRTELRTADRVLRVHTEALGADLIPYRNHVYRVANLCASLSGAESDALEKIVIAAVFHDLGIWTHRTFDYLAPSLGLAEDHLARVGRPEWSTEIRPMILEHHKVLSYRGDGSPLVECFRRADWIDVSLGIRAFGMRRAFVRSLYETWPGAGFHALLARLSLARLLSHPWSPLPMVKL